MLTTEQRAELRAKVGGAIHSAMLELERAAFYHRQTKHACDVLLQLIANLAAERDHYRAQTDPFIEWAQDGERFDSGRWAGFSVFHMVMTEYDEQAPDAKRWRWAREHPLQFAAASRVAMNVEEVDAYVDAEIAKEADRG